MYECKQLPMQSPQKYKSKRKQQNSPIFLNTVIQNSVFHYNNSPSYLIKKYGHDNVELLNAYLQNQLKASLQNENFQDANALRQKIDVLHSQNKKHYQYRKQQIIRHLSLLMQNESIEVIKEFERQYDEEIKAIIEQVQQIKGQLVIFHKSEYDELIQQFQQKKLYKNMRPTPQILRLTHQIERLLHIEDYISANNVKKALDQQIKRNKDKKLFENQTLKKSKVKALKKRQKKEFDAMQCRLRTMVQEKIRSKEEQLKNLLNRMKVVADKIQKNLYSQSYQEQISNILQYKNNCSPEDKNSQNSTKVQTAAHTTRLDSKIQNNRKS